MRVTAVRAVPLAAPWEAVFGGADAVPPELRRPAAHFQTFPRRGQSSVLVTVEAEGGPSGTGEAWGLPAPRATAALVNDYLGLALVGRDARDISGIWDDVYAHAASLGNTRGPWMEALSGIDTALWDLRGRAEGRLLSEMVGGGGGRSVPCYASPVPLLPTPEASAAAALAFVRQGFRAVKVKAGRPSLRDDLEHLIAVRQAVGPGIALMADLNAGSSVAGAIAFARQAEREGLDLAWIEEPVASERLEDLSEIRRAVRTPVAAGENEFSPDSFAALLYDGEVDILTPNVTRAGGITGVLRIAEMAAGHGGARLSLHGVGGAVMLATSLHLSASVAGVGGPLEANRLPNPLRDNLAEGAPFPFADGALSVPARPGIGIELDPAAVARWSAGDAS